MQTRKYFFINDELHQRLAVNRGKDLLWTWNYPQHRRMMYTWSDAVRRMEPAFRSRDVARMLMRSKRQVERAVWEGKVPQPQFTYGIESGNMYSYMWSEKEIMQLLDFFASVHWGRPRKDGFVVPKELPTPREVRAMIRDDKVLYGKKDYKPSWQAKEIKGEK